jgi:hypothetical protein
MAISVEVNEVQLGTAKSMKDKGGFIKYEKFSVLSIRNSVSRFLDVDWNALGEVDMIVNMAKLRIRVYPHGTTDKDKAIIEAKIEKPKKGKTGVIDIDWCVGTGRYARHTRAAFFRIPDELPPYVKGSKPKKEEAKTRTKPKKQQKR